MQKEGKQVSRRWRTAAVLALGVAIGTVLVATPAASHIGTVSHLWKNHIRPKADARYVKKSAIKTIQGDWALGLQAASTDDDGWDNISFGFKLSTAPQAHFILAAGTPPAECPGTVANPRAAPGHLCVYENDSTNRGSVTVFSVPGGGAAADPWGAGLWLQPAAAGNSWSYGTWAVTAGNGVTVSRATPSTARPGH
jgi:hypothetical protein